MAGLARLVDELLAAGATTDATPPNRCCDRVGWSLTAAAGGRQRRVEGSSDEHIPPGLGSLLGKLQRLAIL